MEDTAQIERLCSKIDTLVSLIKISTLDVFGVDEAATYLGLSKDRIYALVGAKEIPYSKPGKMLYFNRKDLDRWIERSRVKTNDEIGSEASTYVSLKRRK